MINTVQAMLEAGIIEATDFPADSRYHGIPTRTMVTGDGRQIAYLARRFVPSAEAFATLGYRAVAEGERLDRIAAEALGNPEAFWLLCEANGAIWAEELEEPGRRLRLTLPQGVPGGAEDAP